MASVVRLSLTLIVCVQLALGNLPALLHKASCDCPAIHSNSVASVEQRSGGQLCRQHCHCNHDGSESSDVASSTHREGPEQGRPLGEEGSHDEDRCALCQSVYVYGTQAKFVCAPVVERFFCKILPIYRCEGMPTGDCSLPSPRGPPLS